MDFEQLANLIQENCPQILRNSWKPVEAKQKSGYKLTTKFGGSDPFRGTNFQWPRCEDKKCGKQKSFICQINLSDLPNQVKAHIGKDSGLFQCFWCTAMFGCDKWATIGGDDDDEASLSSNIKFIPRSEMIPSLQTLAAVAVHENKASTDNLPDAMKTFVEKTNEEFEGMERREERVGEEVQVESWRESAAKELPVAMEMMDNEKISEVVLAQPGITEDVLYEVEFYDGEDAEPIGTPLRGVKLGGYVAWFEGEMAYSTCPNCEVDMDVTFLQLEYDRHVLKYAWDSGAAVVTLCPECGKPDMYWRNNP